MSPLGELATMQLCCTSEDLSADRESTLKALFEDESRLSQLDFKILTKGPDDVSEQDAFTLKEVPIVSQSLLLYHCTEAIMFILCSMA